MFSAKTSFMFKQMPTFENLPVELRLHIFSIAVAEAERKCLWRKELKEHVASKEPLIEIHMFNDQYAYVVVNDGKTRIVFDSFGSWIRFSYMVNDILIAEYEWEREQLHRKVDGQWKVEKDHWKVIDNVNDVEKADDGRPFSM